MALPGDIKDGLSHLVTVQFFLLTVILVGFAADVGLEKSELAVAKDQLSAIRDVALKWDHDWLEKYAKREAGADPVGGRTKFLFTVEKGYVLVNVAMPYQVRPLPAELEARLGDPRGFQSNVLPARLALPETLVDFFSLWDQLNSRIAIHGHFEPIDQAPILRSRMAPPRRLAASKVLAESAAPAAFAKVQEIEGRVTMAHPSDMKGLGESEPLHTIRSSLVFAGAPYFVYIFAKGKTVSTFHGQQALIASHSLPWHLGKSGEVFRELKSVTKAYANLSLDQIDAILVEQAASHGKDISVGGVDIPKGQLAAWTLVLVLAIQIYLLFQVRGLLVALPTEATPSFHHWLGLSPGTAGFMLAFVIYVGLPVAFVLAKAGIVWTLPGGTAMRQVLLALAVLASAGIGTLFTNRLLRVRKRLAHAFHELG